MEGKLPQVRLADTPFRVVSPYEPAGDQPQAIEALARGVRDGLRYQTLLGVTGSGKTFTMAKTIEAVQKPTLIMAPNKTLAAQLASELREFFPDNAVVDQRRGREAAPCRDIGAALTPRLHRGCKRVLHLRHRFSCGLRGYGGVPRCREGNVAR